MQDELISRQAAIDAVNDVIADYVPNLFGRYEALPLEMASAINRLPSVNPQYTEDKIQKMQELEQAEIQKAYELGKAEEQKSEDAISRQAVLDYMDKMPSELTADGRRMIRRRTLEEYISDSLSSVNPQPKTGHWIQTQEKDDAEPFILWECSECHKEFRSIVHKVSNYCPNCGAKMI